MEITIWNSWMVKENNMKLYISTKIMTFEEDNIEHDIIRNIRDKEILCYDHIIELSDDDEFIEDTLKIIYKKDKYDRDTEEIEHKVFIVNEQGTWWSFPLYEIKNGKIIPFDYTKYDYFTNTDRRMMLASKINELYNPPSEFKILRKTLKYIMDTLDIEYPDYFKKYNDKIEKIINKNPKGGK